MQDILIIIGLFAGVLSRSFLPYLRKTLKESEKLKWDHRYTAIIIVSLIITIMIYPSFSPPVDKELIIFSSAFIFGFGFDSILTEFREWMK
jgi:hypothetical protein